MSRIVLVTGMSGAGRTSALKSLEDLGFEAVDNLPATLLGHLIRSGDQVERDVAIGIDCRTRAFDPQKLANQLAERTSAQASHPAPAVPRLRGRDPAPALHRVAPPPPARPRPAGDRRHHPRAPADGAAARARRSGDRHLAAAARPAAPADRRPLRRAGDRPADPVGGLLRLSQRPAARGRSGVRRALPRQSALRRRAAAADRQRPGGARLRRGRSRLRAADGPARRAACCRCCRSTSARARAISRSPSAVPAAATARSWWPSASPQRLRERRLAGDAVASRHAGSQSRRPRGAGAARPSASRRSPPSSRLTIQERRLP